jgi:hypothetical protein
LLTRSGTYRFWNRPKGGTGQTVHKNSKNHWPFFRRFWMIQDFLNSWAGEIIEA